MEAHIFKIVNSALSVTFTLEALKFEENAILEKCIEKNYLKFQLCEIVHSTKSVHVAIVVLRSIIFFYS